MDASGETTEKHNPAVAVSAPTASATDACQDRCVICLDALSEPCLAQPCAHSHFDFLCLVSWLMRDAQNESQPPSCPLCKAAVATVQYGFADGHWKTFAVPNPTRTEKTSTPLSSSSSSSSYAATLLRSNRLRRRRRDGFPSSTTSPSLAAAIDRRRRVYRLGLFSLHVGANRHSRYYRELTPRMFVQDPDLVSRARAFVRRELVAVLDASGPSSSSASSSSSSESPPPVSETHEFLIEYVVAILQTMDTQGSSGKAEDLLCDFFGRDRARLFLHELRSWLRSPYLTLESWDRHVQYGAPEKSWGTRRDGDEDADRPRVTRVAARPAYCTPRRDRHSPPRRGDSGRSALQEACRRYDPT